MNIDCPLDSINRICCPIVFLHAGARVATQSLWRGCACRRPWLGNLAARLDYASDDRRIFKSTFSHVRDYGSTVYHLVDLVDSWEEHRLHAITNSFPMRVCDDSILTSNEERPERDFETSSCERSEKHAGTTTVLRRLQAETEQLTQRPSDHDVAAVCRWLETRHDCRQSQISNLSRGSYRIGVDMSCNTEVVHYWGRSLTTFIIPLGYRMLIKPLLCFSASMCGASSQDACGVYSLAYKPSAIMILAKILRPFRRDPMFIVSTRLDSTRTSQRSCLLEITDMTFFSAQLSAYSGKLE
jgi:hypothetical protein